MTSERDGYPPFSNTRFFRQLSLAGARSGLQVFVFSPRRIDWTGERVDGYVYNRDTGIWERRNLPLPDLVYDRFFYIPGRQYALARAHVRRLRSLGRTRFLGIGLPGKYHVHRLLSGDEKLRPHLPDLRKVTRLREIGDMLATYGDLVLKPQGGSQGRGVFRLTALGDGPVRFLAAGRNQQNGLFRREFETRRELAAWLAVRLKRRAYIAEPYLELTTRSGEPYDLRAFVQKNRRGRWQWVGMAARVGRPGQLTSNLHGGGKAVDATALLEAQFGGKASAIARTVRTLGLRIARVLQERHGRLLEIGLDFGVDPSGTVWFLEANSRPGRSIFARIGDRAASKRAIWNPIHYACYLRDRQLGG